jgi:hypothetical protein
VAFLDNGQSLASQGSPARLGLREVRSGLRLVPVEPGLCSPDLRRRTRSSRRATCVAGCLSNSSLRAVYHVTCYQIVSLLPNLAVSGLWKPCGHNDSGIHRNLALAVRTIVRSPAGQDHAPNRSPTHQAGLSGAHVDTMLELEEAFDTVRVHIIRNRRPAQ